MCMAQIDFKVLQGPEDFPAIPWDCWPPEYAESQACLSLCHSNLGYLTSHFLLHLHVPLQGGVLSPGPPSSRCRVTKEGSRTLPAQGLLISASLITTHCPALPRAPLQAGLPAARSPFPLAPVSQCSTAVMLGSQEARVSLAECSASPLRNLHCLAFMTCAIKQTEGLQQVRLWGDHRLLALSCMVTAVPNGA